MRTKMLWLAVLIAVFAVFCLQAPMAIAQQAEDKEIMDEQKKINEVAAYDEDSFRKALRSKYDVSAEQINDLRAKNLGYGEISTVFSLAERSDGGLTQENINTIANMRTGGNKKGWGVIAKQYGVKVGALKKNLKAVRAHRKKQQKMKMRDKRGTRNNLEKQKMRKAGSMGTKGKSGGKKGRGSK